MEQGPVKQFFGLLGVLQLNRLVRVQKKSEVRPPELLKDRLERFGIVHSQMTERMLQHLILFIAAEEFLANRGQFVWGSLREKGHRGSN